MADPVVAAQRVEPILAAAQRAHPSPAAEIEMESRCGGRTHGLGFLSVMEVQVSDESEVVLSLAPCLEA